MVRTYFRVASRSTSSGAASPPRGTASSVVSSALWWQFHGVVDRGEFYYFFMLQLEKKIDVVVFVTTLAGLKRIRPGGSQQ